MSPESVMTVVGVCLGHGTGVVVKAARTGGVATAAELRRYGPNLEPLASDVRQLLTEGDAGLVVVVDSGLRGRELLDQIGWTHDRQQPRRLYEFEAVAEERRYRIAGRLTQLLESGAAKIRRDLLDDELHATLAATSRADAGDRPEVVALSLALQEPPIRQPRYGRGF